MNSYCVYIHITPSGKVYIGQTCQTVNQRWLKGEGYSDNPHFYNAIRKYEWDNIQHDVIASNLSAEQADELERQLINKYDATNPDKGYNVQLGGHSLHVHSDETKQKISDRMKETYKAGFSEEQRKKHSERMKQVYGAEAL